MTPDQNPRGSLSLAPHTFLSVRGPDAERFLNGQLTNDIRLASESRCIYSAILNAKGQLDAVCHVRMIDGSYLLDAPGGLSDTLVTRLDRYLIADEVELADESGAWHLYHLVGMPPDTLPGDLPGTTHLAAVNRLGVDGYDLLSPDPLSLQIPVLGPDDAEALRIAHGIPELGKPAGVPCAYLRPGGCAIYESRPIVCQRYSCLWLQGYLGDEDRPDKLGVLFVAFEEDGQKLLGSYDLRPGARETTRANEALEELRNLRL